MDRNPLIRKLMKKKGMKKILILFAIIVMLLLQSSLASAQLEKGSQKQSLFGLQFVMNITWDGNDTQTPIRPGEVRQVHLVVTYTVTRGAFGRMFFHFLDGRFFSLRLSIIDKSDWCTALLSVENFIGVITPDETQTTASMLYIQLSEDAPLNYTLGYVKLRGVIDNMQGPFNKVILIQGYEANFTVPFITSP